MKKGRSFQKYRWALWLLVLAAVAVVYLVRLSPRTPDGAIRRASFLQFYPISALFLNAEPVSEEKAELYADDYPEGAGLYLAYTYPGGRAGSGVRFWAVTEQDGRYYAAPTEGPLVAGPPKDSFTQGRLSDVRRLALPLGELAAKPPERVKDHTPKPSQSRLRP